MVLEFISGRLSCNHKMCIAHAVAIRLLCSLNIDVDLDGLLSLQSPTFPLGSPIHVTHW